MTTTPPNERVAKSRAKKAVLKQVEAAGFELVDVPDLIIRRPDGNLYAWHHPAGWQRLTTTV